MRIILEEDKKTKEDWMETISLDENEFFSLVTRGILKNGSNNNFKCEFVGEIVTKNEFVISLPKVYMHHMQYSHIDIMLTNRVLRKFYQEKVKKCAVTSQELESLYFYDDDVSTEYEVFLSIKRYSEVYGIYKSKIRNRSTGYNKKIDWKRTVSNSLALHDDSSLVYDNPINIIHDFEYNEVSEIFYAVLCYLGSKYSFVNSIINHEYIGMEKIPQNILFRKRNIFSRVISVEMAKTFNTEDLNVLQILHAYLSDNLSHSGDFNVLAFGTSSFHVIWEELCGCVFKNNYRELSINVSQPVWVDSGNVTRSKGNLRPDVLVEDESSFYILDAKYYYPFPDNHCGVGDIAKQYIYAKAFDSGNKDIMNGFLFPSHSNVKVSNCGTLKMFKFDDSVNNRFDNIEICVFQIDYSSLATTYLGRSEVEGYLKELKLLFADTLQL